MPKDKNTIPLLNLSLDHAQEDAEEEDNFNSPKDSDRDSMIQPKDNQSDEIGRELQPNLDFYEDENIKLKHKLMVESQSSERHFWPQFVSAH